LQVFDFQRIKRHVPFAVSVELVRNEIIMQQSEAEELRKTWGDRPCEHHDLVQEYHLGTGTGDYVCTRCGCTGWGRDWPQKEKEEKESNSKKNV
jgi:hypothetical protein